MTSLREAQDTLRAQLQSGEAVQCPVCTQLAKIYKRKINSGMAYALIVMWGHAGTDWFYMPAIASRWQGRDEAGLRYWGLIEEAQEKREDGGRAGWWRITPLGASFVRGHTRVGKYASIYDGRCLGIDQTEQVSIRDALGDKFDYEELMSA